jgi:hypothetical protein
MRSREKTPSRGSAGACSVPYFGEVTVAHDAQAGRSRASRCLDWTRGTGLDGIMLL